MFPAVLGTFQSPEYFFPVEKPISGSVVWHLDKRLQTKQYRQIFLLSKINMISTQSRVGVSKCGVRLETLLGGPTE